MRLSRKAFLFAQKERQTVFLFFAVTLRKSLFTARSSSCLGPPWPFSGSNMCSASMLVAG